MQKASAANADVLAKNIDVQLLYVRLVAVTREEDR